MFSGTVLTLLCLSTVVLSAPPSIGRVPTERWFLPKTTVTQLRTLTTTEKMRPSCVHFEPGTETCERTRMARISPTSVMSSAMMRSSVIENDPLISELSPSPSMTLAIAQDNSMVHKISSPKFFDNWSLLEYFESTVTKVVMVMETKRVIDPRSVVTLTVSGCSTAPSDVPICEEDIILPSTQEVIMSTIVPMATDTLITVDEKLSVTPIIDIEENTPTSNPEETTTVGFDEQGTTVEGGTTVESTDEAKILDSQTTESITEDSNVITTTDISQTTKVTLQPEQTDNADETQEEVITVNEPVEREDKIEKHLGNSEVRKIDIFMDGFSEKQNTEATFENNKNQPQGLKTEGISDLSTLTETVETATLPEERDSESKKEDSINMSVTTIPPQDNELSDRTNSMSESEENSGKITSAFVVELVKNIPLEFSQIDKNNDLKSSNDYLLESERLREVNAPTEIPEDTVMVSVIVQDNAEKSTTIINNIIKAQDLPTSTDDLPQVEETLSSILSLLPARQDNAA